MLWVKVNDQQFKKCLKALTKVDSAEIQLNVALNGSQDLFRPDLKFIPCEDNAVITRGNIMFTL